ncbi:MAG: hypothetical protein RIC35_01710 [Marinoscillum sp.]
MAIYQYYLAVIPLEGVQKKHDSIPDSIRTSTETGYFESEAKIYWKEAEISANELVSELDGIITRANWGNDDTSYNWKKHTREADNDASIFLEEGSSFIKEFSFRADLREKNLTFLLNMIELGKSHNWVFMDRTGKLMKADFEIIKDSIKRSNNYKFLKDPEDYLNSLG